MHFVLNKLQCGESLRILSIFVHFPYCSKADPKVGQKMSLLHVVDKNNISLPSVELFVLPNVSLFWLIGFFSCADREKKMFKLLCSVTFFGLH